MAIHNYLIYSHVRDGLCLLHGMGWIFKYNWVSFRSACKIAKRYYCLRQVSPSDLLYISMENSSPIESIVMKFGIWEFLKNLSRKFKLHQNERRKTDALREDVCTSMAISLWVCRMRKYWVKICRENRNTHFIFKNFLPIICVLWDNV